MRITKLIPIISGGIIFGFIIGFIIAFYHIISNSYLQYRLFGISLSALQYFINYSVLFAIIAFFIIYGTWHILTKIFNLNKSRLARLYRIGIIIIFMVMSLDFFSRAFSGFSLKYGIKLLAKIVLRYSSGGIGFYLFINSLVDNLGSFLLLGFFVLLCTFFLYFFLSKIHLNIYDKFRSKGFSVIGLVFFCLFIFINTIIFFNEYKKTSHGPNVIFIVVDALRADHISAYGYDKLTSPVIDELCNDGISFQRAFSQGNMTSISMPSLFTGMYPSDPGYHIFRKLEYKLAPLGNKFTTITEIFKNAWYKTKAVSCQPWISPDTGFGQGFDSFEIVSNLNDNLSDKKTIDRALEWLDKNHSKKFFLFINLMGPHTPYHPPPPYDTLHSSKTERSSKLINKLIDYYQKKDHDNYYRLLMEIDKKNISKEDLNDIISLYDGKISFTDAQIGRLVSKLKDLNIYNNSLTVLTADHGEAFLEHDKLLHGSYLYNEEIHVPLIMTYPEKLQKYQQLVNTVELVDVLPTIADAVDISIGEIKIRGTSLLPVIEDSSYPDSFAYSEGTLSHKEQVRIVKYMNDKWSLICNSLNWQCDLYDLEIDPEETLNIIESEPEIASDMKDRLMKIIDDKMYPSLKEVRTIDISESTKKKLKSLGYLR